MSTPPPTFSIVTVAYNCANELAATLASIRAQTYTDYELIVVDGGSTDGTVEVARAFQGPLAALISEPDRGIYDAMNKGIRIARGVYVHFLNAGDSYHDELSLARVAGALRGADLVWGDVELVYPTFRRRVRYPPRLSLTYLALDMICHQALFFRRDLFARLGEYSFDKGVFGDWEFLLRAWKAGATTHHLPEPVVHYDMTGGSIGVKFPRRARGVLIRRHAGLFAYLWLWVVWYTIRYPYRVAQRLVPDFKWRWSTCGLP